MYIWNVFLGKYFQTARHNITFHRGHSIHCWNHRKKRLFCFAMTSQFLFHWYSLCCKIYDMDRLQRSFKIIPMTKSLVFIILFWIQLYWRKNIRPDRVWSLYFQDRILREFRFKFIDLDQTPFDEYLAWNVISLSIKSLMILKIPNQQNFPRRPILSGFLFEVCGAGVFLSKESQALTKERETMQTILFSCLGKSLPFQGHF